MRNLKKPQIRTKDKRNKKKEAEHTHTTIDVFETEAGHRGKRVKDQIID